MRIERREIAWLLALTVAALALRLPRLDVLPPGMLIDEAYQGLQGVSLWSGEKLPDIPEQGHSPSCPLWAALVAVSTRLFGVTLAAARLPAAIIGTLSVPLAWLVARSLMGRAAAWTAAIFLCGSFWHVQYSRQCWPWVTLVAEGLVTCWLLLAPALSGRLLAGAAAGLVAGLSCYEYPSAFHLVIWGFAVAGLKVAFDPAGRRRAVRLGLAFAAGLGAGLAPMALGLQGTVQLGRTSAIGATAREATLAGHLIPFANLFVRVPAAPAQWTNHPAGSPRLSMPERAALVAGLVASVATITVAPVIRASVGLWLPLALLPEAVPGDLHLSRGVGALAPLALLIGLGGAFVAARLGRAAFAAVLAAGLLNVAWSAKHLYVDYARDPVVRSSFQSVYMDVAAFVRRRAAEAPVRIPAVNYSYENNAVLGYLLWREVHAGRILPITMGAGAGAGFRLTPDFFRHPVNGEPFFVILGTNRYPADRKLAIMSVDGLLDPARQNEAAGRFADAEAHYRYLLSVFPDSAWTRVNLARLLLRTGRKAEATREFAEARRLGYAGPLPESPGPTP